MELHVGERAIAGMTFLQASKLSNLRRAAMLLSLRIGFYISLSLSFY